jgi:hypothetical protein
VLAEEREQSQEQDKRGADREREQMRELRSSCGAGHASYSTTPRRTRRVRSFFPRDSVRNGSRANSVLPSRGPRPEPAADGKSERLERSDPT